MNMAISDWVKLVRAVTPHLREPGESRSEAERRTQAAIRAIDDAGYTIVESPTEEVPWHEAFVDQRTVVSKYGEGKVRQVFHIDGDKVLLQTYNGANLATVKAKGGIVTVRRMTDSDNERTT